MKLRATGMAVAIALMGTAAETAIGYDGGKEGKSYVAKAIHSDIRPADDKKRDAARKPHKVIKFAGIGPGMTVLDINSGGGWYTEILSAVVGPEGRVIAHNGPAYWSFMKETEPARYADGRLTNVTQVHNGQEVIDMPEGSLDAAFSALAYHDYFMNEAAVNDPAVLAAVNASIYKALKPGGVYIMIDHVAPAGSGAATGGTMHRIDPAIVQEQLEAVGFKLAGSADFLANPDDSKETGPFDPSIRGKTDRFVYKFVK